MRSVGPPRVYSMACGPLEEANIILQRATNAGMHLNALSRSSPSLRRISVVLTDTATWPCIQVLCDRVHGTVLACDLSDVVDDGTRLPWLTAVYNVSLFDTDMLATSLGFVACTSERILTEKNSAFDMYVIFVRFCFSAF